MPSSRLLSISFKDLPARCFEQSFFIYFSQLTDCFCFAASVNCELCLCCTSCRNMHEDLVSTSSYLSVTARAANEPLCCRPFDNLSFFCLFALYLRRRACVCVWCSVSQETWAQPRVTKITFSQKFAQFIKFFFWVCINFSSFSSSAADRDSSLCHNLQFSYIHFSFCETVLATRDEPRDYCHSQPQYYRITVRQSDSWCCADNYSAAWISVEKLH